MIFRRTQSQVKRLRDLMSEVQENHTRIQRLWKKVDDAQLILPVGIAAAPPIDGGTPDSGSESSSSSSSSEIFCYPCHGGIPSTLALDVSKTGSFAFYLEIPDGTYMLSYSADKSTDGENVWISDCFAVGEGYYAQLVFSCLIGNDVSYSLAEFFVSNLSACESGSFPFAPVALMYPSNTNSRSCDPFHISATLDEGGGNTITFEITE